jgi:ATP-dependent helicase/nuclease subunit A
MKELMQPLHEEFRASTVTPYLSRWRQYVYRLAVTLLTRARTHAAADRRRANTLNYGDLLILTARVLRENAEVRRSLQRKYRHLFVDEFQDTDPVQAEIVFLLAGDETRGGSVRLQADEAGDRSVRSQPDMAADWRTIALRPGALFIVGDPKQSIYRFRRADIDIYNIVRERFSDTADGRVLPLTVNFRSIPALCRWANDVFRQHFPEEPTAYSPRFAALNPHENDRAGGLFIITHTGDRSDVPLDDAAKIAAYVRGEVDAGRRRFGDFLILTRRKRDLGIYVAALEALDVPIEVSGAGAFGESPQVAALIQLLRALADPQDAIALVAVLRGPFFGVSDRELFAFRQSGGWFNIFTRSFRIQAEANDAEPDPVASALDAVHQYYRWTRVLPAAAALERILEHSGFLALAATTPGGVEAGDLLHAVDRVRHVVEDGGTLADAADSLEEDVDDNEVESLPLEPGRTDVVRLMNLHKAKGLEAAVVFLADPTGGFPQRIDRRIVRTDVARTDVVSASAGRRSFSEGGRRTNAAAQGWFRIQKRFESGGSQVLGEPAGWDEHEAAELPYLQAEEQRLLYVAATRAREQLVISRWIGGTNRFPAWGVLNDALATAQELAIPSSVTIPAVTPLDCSAATNAKAAADRGAAHVRVREASWSVTSVTAEAKRLDRVTEPVTAAADDPTKVVTRDTAAHRADAGMAWGTLIHGLLEHAMRHQSATRDDLRRLGMWLTCDEPQLRVVLDDAVEIVLQLAAADWWRAAKAGEHSEETPFTVRQDGGALNVGVIDLLFRHAAAWHIRDYKTDLSLDAADYQKQLQVYRNALSAVGCDVGQADLIHVRPAPPLR